MRHRDGAPRGDPRTADGRRGRRRRGSFARPRTRARRRSRRRCCPRCACARLPRRGWTRRGRCGWRRCRRRCRSRRQRPTPGCDRRRHRRWASHSPDGHRPSAPHARRATPRPAADGSSARHVRQRSWSCCVPDWRRGAGPATGSYSSPELLSCSSFARSSRKSARASADSDRRLTGPESKISRIARVRRRTSDPCRSTNSTQRGAHHWSRRAVRRAPFGPGEHEAAIVGADHHELHRAGARGVAAGGDAAVVVGHVRSTPRPWWRVAPRSS
jgi:hypothetical protein